MTELLVVIAIILLITIASLPAVLGALEDRKLNEAVRTLQAALAGARDRAIMSKQVQGLRLVRDEIDPWEVSTLVYVGIPEPYAVGRVTVSGATVTPWVDPNSQIPTPVFDQIDRGKDNTSGTADDIPRVVANESYIRFDGVGPLYLVTAVNPATGNPPLSSLTIAPSAVSVMTNTSGHTFRVSGAPVPLPQDAPIKLPEGIVIDLRTPLVTLQSSPGASDRELLRLPRSRGVPRQYPLGVLMPWGVNGIWGDNDDPASPAPAANWPTMDILFGPHGGVIGEAAANPLIHFWLGERGDKGDIGSDATGGTGDDARPNRPFRLMTLNTRTGAVETWQDPNPVGTSANRYSEVYGEAEQKLGSSAPLVEEWIR